VRFACGSIDEAPDDGGFDVITCMHAFPYVRDPDAAAARIRSLLRPGGRVLIVQANAHSAFDHIVLWFVERTTTPARYRSTDELCAILSRAGLRAGVVRPLPRPWFVPSIHLVEGLA
jgi:2-polyprenyl-3-methyl-5-hydroxy-6-metoxy-1,4-benzoquinol methylase